MAKAPRCENPNFTGWIAAGKLSNSHVIKEVHGCADIRLTVKRPNYFADEYREPESGFCAITPREVTGRQQHDIRPFETMMP